VNAKTTAAKIALVTIGAAATAMALAGTASAAVTAGSYTAAAYPLAPSLWLPLTADAAIVGDTLAIAGVPVARITPTDDGGTAVVGSQRYVFTPGPGPGDYTISTADGTTRGWILAR
jgi:hypothetical protein